MVGITVGETSISGLQNPMQLTFAHGQLPHVSQPCPPSICPLVPLTVVSADAALPPLQGVTPQCVFWDASKGMVLGGAGHGAGHGCCARRSRPSPCACRRAGRRLEQQRMRHAARGQGDSLLL